MERPRWGCCPETEPWIIGRSWLAAYTITGWGTPMSYAPAQHNQQVCVTGFYSTRTVEYFSYTDFDFNRPVLMETVTQSLSLPGGQLNTSSTGSGGAFGGLIVEVVSLLSESDTSFHLGAFSNDPSIPGSAVNSIRVTLSNPFDPETYFSDVLAAIGSKFDEPWDPEGLMNTQGPGAVPPMDWVAYYARDNTLVCGHSSDIARERGLNDFNFFIPVPRYPGDGADVCGMEAYSFKESTIHLFGGSGAQNSTRHHMFNPIAYYNKVWRRVEWAWGGPGAGPFFEWQRDNVSLWGPDGCTPARSSACPRPFATRCVPLTPAGRIVREPPVDANTYGRTVRSSCQ